MKLLIVSDLHYALPQFDWVLDRAGAYDALVLAGDLLDAAGALEPDAQIVVVNTYLKRLMGATRLMVCSGNHDLDSTGVNGEKQAVWFKSARQLGIPVDGDTLTIGDTLVTLCPWWDGPATRNEIAAQLAKATEQRTGRWIWVYHAPPPDSPTSWSGQRHFGDNALAEWVAQYQPDFVFCGHVHEAPFARGGSWVDQIGKSWVFNAGRQIGDIPTAIMLDTEAKEAAWFSFEGAESIRLDAPLTRPIPPLTALPDWLERV